MVSGPSSRRTGRKEPRTAGEERDHDPLDDSPGAALVRNEDEIPEPNEPA